MDAHVHLTVPPAAQTARLLVRNRNWGIYYRSLLDDTEGQVEFRQIDLDMLRADDVDPADAGAVIAHVEHRLQASGYDTTRRPDEGTSIAASWDIRRRATA